MELDYSAFSTKGKSHKFNEDRYRLLGGKIPLVEKSGRGEVYAVFDGMGSAQRGAEAAQYMCDRLFDVYQDETFSATPEVFGALLQNANKTINEWGCMQSASRPLGACSGTVAWFYDGSLLTFHAGDTFALLLHGDCDDASEYEILTTEHAIGHGLLRYFGMGQFLKIEVRRHEINDGDILLLISDGVMKSVGFKLMAEKVRFWIRHSPQFAAQELCRLSEHYGSTDDITVVLVEVVEK